MIYLAVGFLVAPRILQDRLVDSLKADAGIDLAIERLAVNPLTLSVTTGPFEATDRVQRPLIAAEYAHINFQWLPLLAGTIRFKFIELGGPRAYLEVDGDGAVHWLDSVPESDAGPTETPESEPWGLAIDQLIISGGRLDYSEPQHPEQYQTLVSDLNFELVDLDTSLSGPAPISLALSAESGGAVSYSGELKTDPLQVAGQLSIADFELEPGWRYARHLHQLILNRGTLNAGINLSVSMEPEGIQVVTRDGEWQIDQLSVSVPGDAEPLLVLESASMVGPDLNLQERRVAIDEIAIAGGQVTAIRENETEQLTLLAHLAEFLAETETETDSSSEPWSLEITSVRASDLVQRLIDQAVEPVFDRSFGVTSLDVSDINLREGSRFPYRAEIVADSARASVSGEFGISPVAASVDVSLESLPLSWFEGYVREFADIAVEAGEINTAIRMEAVDGALAELSGDLEVSGLVTRSRPLDSDLVSLDRMTLNGIDVDPERTSAAELVIDGPVLQYAISEDGSNSVATLFPQDEDDTSAPDESAQSPGSPSTRVELGQVLVTNGAVQFQDQSVQPATRFDVREVKAEITGLTNSIDQPGSVTMSGKVLGYADIELAGSLTPLTSEQQTDISISTTNIDLTAVNPYAGKFVGRLIERGRLDLELRYQLEGRSLRGSNRVTLGQFELGRSVESPDAVSVPLDLAVALLRDPSGNLDLDIPVAGDLDDPEFRLGGVVFKAFVNLMVKAVASPFFIIGKLVPGGGEDLQYIEFAAGEASLDEKAAGRIEKLAGALAQRPGLRLEISGLAAADVDGMALRRTELVAELGEVTTEERPARLAAMVLAQTGSPAPEGASESELEALLLEQITIPEDQLRAIADERARNIKQAFAEADAAMTERVYLLDSTIVPLSGTERVQLTLDLESD